MRRRFTLNTQTMGRELLVVSQRDEVVNTRLARWLSEAHQPFLLRFEYEMTHGGNGALLHYDVKGLVSLKSYLRRTVLDEQTFVCLLASVQEVLDACSAHGVPTELLTFDPSFVFVDNRAQPRFVITPLENVPFAVESSPLFMLGMLGNPRKLKFSSPRVEMLSSKLEVFVLNQNNVFSANAFRGFLRDQCGIDRNQRRLSNIDAPMQGRSTNEGDETSLRMWNGVSGAGSRNVQVGIVNRYQLQRLSNNETFSIAEGQAIRIGRGSRSSVQIVGNPKLSRNHAELLCSRDAVTLRDLGSANGTWVGGSRLQPNTKTVISVGQRFSLANEEFVVRRAR